MFIEDVAAAVQAGEYTVEDVFALAWNEPWEADIFQACLSREDLRGTAQIAYALMGIAYGAGLSELVERVPKTTLELVVRYLDIYHHGDEQLWASRQAGSIKRMTLADFERHVSWLNEMRIEPSMAETFTKLGDGWDDTFINLVDAARALARPS